MELLIIEDDAFKFSKVEVVARSSVSDVNVIHLDNVHDAVVYLQSAMPDKIILDMSLPSHAAKMGEGSPLPMPAGGIEVIMELRILGKLDIPIIILTQYHEVEIEGEYYTLAESEEEIKSLYGMNHINVCLYQGEADEWSRKVAEFLVN